MRGALQSLGAVPMIKIKTSISAKSEYTGIYLAYPTTTTLKQTYRNHKSMVNDQHTKVGITVKSFRERSNEYERTFDGEVEFVPLVVMEPEQLALIEKDILSALRAEFGNVGRTREWFDTSDRTRIIEIVQEITGGTIGSAL
jgi:hypothetical protein